MEKGAVATETNDMDWLLKIGFDMERNLQSEKDDIDVMWKRGINISLKALKKSTAKTATMNLMKKNCNRQY